MYSSGVSRAFLLSLLLAIVFTGCRMDSDGPDSDIDQELAATLSAVSGGRGISYFALPKESDFSGIPQDPRNPITRSKVELGKLLFHETALGTNPRIPGEENKFSCASCHHAAGGFQANLIQGIGEGGIGYGIAGEARVPDPTVNIDSIDVQPIRTPSALNIAYQECVLWNGQFGGVGLNAGTEANWVAGKPTFDNFLGYEGTETQAIAGLKVHRQVIDSSTLAAASPDYAQLFAYAFPDVPSSQRLDREHAGLAIAAYERTILAYDSPFQRWLRGDNDALDRQEKNGALLFFGKARCVTCHTGPALNSMEFYGLGMPNLVGPGIYGSNGADAAHKGRGGFTKKAEDMHKFKVPQLYNLKDSPFYGHGGNFRSIEEVIRYKNKGVPINAAVPTENLAAEFRALDLTDQEIKDITRFIENGLYDPNLNRFVPNSIPSGQCFPNNDLQSRLDRGCN